MSRHILNQILPVVHWTVLIQLIAISAAWLVTPLRSQSPLTVEFNLLELPSSRQALAVLGTPAMATFENRPLSECLDSLAAAYRVSIWIDRRVDRSRLISIVGLGLKDSQEAKTTLGCISAVARLGGAEAGLIENVIYVGPADQVAAVQRAAVRLHNEIMALRKDHPSGSKAELRTLNWDELTTPSELLASIQSQWTANVRSELPHDLMHAGKLPSSTLAVQLTLLHAGFDMQVECTSDGVFVANPLVHQDDWTATYTSKEVQASRYAAARKDFPKATMQTRGNVSTLTGPTGFHLKLLAVRVPVARNIEPKFTIPEFRAPLERIIGDLAKHLAMEVSWSEEIPQSKKRAVMTFGVPKAKTPDEILLQISKDSDLRIQRQEQTIYVYPAADNN